jgi:hypothetical protein
LGGAESAKADPGRRFHALWDKVLRRDVLGRRPVRIGSTRPRHRGAALDGRPRAEVLAEQVSSFPPVGVELIDTTSGEPARRRARLLFTTTHGN